MNRWLLAVGDWFDARLSLRSTLLPMMRHPIPREVAGPMGWWYVFGSASLTLLLVQILTGIGLALVYVPSADKAYDSLLYLNYDVTLGWFLRALHYYAGSGMVVLVLVHATQVFLHGAYKYPRELTWVLGVFSAPLHAGHVLQRPGPPLGPGCLLGPGGRGFDGRARPGHRALGGPHALGRPRDRRRFAQSLLRPARLRRSRGPCCSSWRSTCGSCSRAGSVPRPSPGKRSIRRRMTRLMRSSSRAASRFSAMP